MTDVWHPQYFCHATPILISKNKRAKGAKDRGRGETYTPKGYKNM